MRANALMKANVDELLRRRNLRREDLSKWCRKEVSWASKILNSQTREFPMKYYDRIADLFGVAVYQLFQPGIAASSERRQGSDRRTGRDRRLSSARQVVRDTVSKLTITDADVALLMRIKLQPVEARERVERSLRALPERTSSPKTTGTSGTRGPYLKRTPATDETGPGETKGDDDA